jgi:hypothetical protein
LEHRASNPVSVKNLTAIETSTIVKMLRPYVPVGMKRIRRRRKFEIQQRLRDNEKYNLFLPCRIYDYSQSDFLVLVTMALKHMFLFLDKLMIIFCKKSDKVSSPAIITRVIEPFILCKCIAKIHFTLPSHLCPGLENLFIFISFCLKRKGI